jgi:hypothetical protein
MTQPTFLPALAATLLVTGIAAPAFAQASATLPTLGTPDEAPQVRVGGRLQLMGLADWLQTEPSRSQGRLYMFLKQSRLEVAAKKGAYDFYSQLALGGEDVYTNNVNLTLLDFYAAGPLLGEANWRVGQFRVPYGRELMTNGGSLAFWDRSITSPFFQLGRDVGAAIDGRVGPASVTGGVFLGGGRDVPQRYLPEILGIPLLALRVGVGDLVEDTYNLRQHDGLDADRTRMGLHWSSVFTRDSRVGHSTVLNVKNAFEKSLLLSPAWNPYIAAKDPATGAVPQGQLFQTAIDYAVKTPLAGGTLSGEAELNYGGFANSLGAVSALGGRLQASLTKGACEGSLRYAIVAPGTAFAATTTTAGSPTLGQRTALFPDGSPIQELTPAFTYFLNGDKFKLMVDFPILFNAPVALEKGIGAYNLVNQPDQATLVADPANTLTRQLVLQLRGGVQVAF